MSGDAGFDCNDEDEAINPDALEICDELDNDCDGDIDEEVALGTHSLCPAEDCAEILDGDSSAADGDYYLDAGTYYCDMTTDGGGWTRAFSSNTVDGSHEEIGAQCMPALCWVHL